MSLFDFKNLAAILLADATRWLVNWCPGGKMQGREYVAGTIRGGPGDSFKVNVETGAWADFAGNEKGGDLISLFAAIEGIKQSEAAQHISDLINFPIKPAKEIVKREPVNIGIPPEGAIVPAMLHPKWGKPVASWCYRQPSTLPLFYEARYDTPDGKQYSPWSWDKTSGKWIARGYPAPRPLWGLDHIYRRPHAPVLIVEGPKCAEAALAIAGGVYSVTTWPNGALAYSKVDWSPIYGRDVLIWPDNDEPGIAAGAAIARMLGPHCKLIKVLTVTDQPEHWDAADALAAGWDWPKFKEWAKQRVVVVAETVIMSQNGDKPAVIEEDEEAPSGSISGLYLEYGLATNGKGKAHFNMDNAVRVMDRWPDFQDFAWFDSFYQRIFTKWNGSEREWSDLDTLNLTHFLQKDFKLEGIKPNTVLEALTVYANKRARNKPRDWMESLQWDGAARINSFFWDCFGVTETEYTHAVGANFWIGMVGRILRPGCQLDNMVILEGMQGTGKTSALRIIGGSWYSNAHDSIQNKDFFLSLQGKLIVEISELDSFSRAETRTIKNVVSTNTDRYRSPYARSSEDHPRMCIFVGSTNEKTYLKDHTGGRRFWPVRCNKIDLDKIHADRDQLFAEAVHRFKSGEKWYEMPTGSTVAEQEKRRQSDSWENVIIDWLPSRLATSELTIKEVGTECLKIEIGRLDINTQVRIGKALSNCGFEQIFPENVWRRKELA